MLLLDELVLDHCLDLLGVVLCYVGDRLSSRPYEAFQSKVVARRERVVLVRLYKPASMLPRPLIKGVLVQDDLQLLKVDGDRVLSNYDARVVLDCLDLFEPDVCADVACGETFGGVCVEDAL